MTGKAQTTQPGYVNKHGQKNIGKTDRPGTDNLQWFYQMECSKCGYRYLSNGSTIYEKKCPKCQGGKE